MGSPPGWNFRNHTGPDFFDRRNSLYSRTGGIQPGHFKLALRSAINNINIGNTIDTSHQKQMLTEYPTASAAGTDHFPPDQVAAKPIKKLDPGRIIRCRDRSFHPGQTSHLDYSPVFLILVFFVYRHKTRITLGVNALFLTAALFSIIPWVQFGGQNVSIFSFYTLPGFKR